MRIPTSLRVSNCPPSKSSKTYPDLSIKRSTPSKPQRKSRCHKERPCSPSVKTDIPCSFYSETDFSKAAVSVSL